MNRSLKSILNIRHLNNGLKYNSFKSFNSKSTLITLNNTSYTRGDSYSNSNSNQNRNSNSNNNSNKNINERVILFSLSLGGLFGWKKEEENPYSNIPKTTVGPIETFEDALHWYQTYYLHPNPEQFLKAMIMLLGDESKTFVRQQLNNVRAESDMKSIARISTIQSFYYLPLVGFMAQIFTDHPEQVQQWYTALSTNEEIKTPWKSSLGDLDATMLLTLAVCMTDNEQARKIQQSIVQSYTKPGETAEQIEEHVDNLKKWAYQQTKSTVSLPLVLIGQYFANGKEDVVKNVARLWRSSLDSLENMVIQNADKNANITNNVVKKLEFENRELIIDQLNQAIRLLTKDNRALNILKEEMDHQKKARQEREQFYKNQK
ncbi:hypothetical protein CYY_007342 [Polysphondylium violaceum]|uniref:Uncharacterized protein n=1 Tax=Polysphondylium violaceum TaxID=133409 RepID=A0A8J4PS09_9MYCE|nr:hypothetical protein CYY_007342 [Polysphondylium violaceum]